MSGQIIDTERYQYKRVKIRDKSGKAHYSAGNGDAVARSMLGMTQEDLVAVMKANKLDEKLAKHSKSRNAGHFRMILGQALRGMVGRGESVKIKGNVITKLSQKVDLPKGFVEEPIGTRPVKAKAKKAPAKKKAKKVAKAA